MSRAARLLDLIQALRGRRRPVTAADLAAELGVSIRTIYRDTATLTALGAPIEGEGGLGYVLKPGFFMPPLMLSADEVDAVILGLRFVSRRGDDALRLAARDALAKVAAVLPTEVGNPATNGMLAGPSWAAEGSSLAVIRQAMRTERKLKLTYIDKGGMPSERVIWPVAIGFFDTVEMIAAWCELRSDFRHFRIDRISSLEPTAMRYPKSRSVLLADWQAQSKLDDPI